MTPKGRHILSRRMTDNSALQMVTQTLVNQRSSPNLLTERCTLLAMNEQRRYDYTPTLQIGLKSRKLLRRSRLRAAIINKQESLANEKVSARQPWYIGRNSVAPHVRTPSNINVIYRSLKSTFSAQQFHRWQCGSIFIRLAVVASQTREVTQNSEKI